MFGLPLVGVSRPSFQVGMQPAPCIQEWLEPFGGGEVSRSSAVYSRTAKTLRASADAPKLNRVWLIRPRKGTR